MEIFNSNRLLKIVSSMKLYAIALLLISLFAGYFYSYYYKVPMYQSTAVIVLAHDINSTSNNSEDTSYITRCRYYIK